MSNLKIAFLVFIVGLFSSCGGQNNCADHVEKSYYGKSNIRTRTISNCNQHLKSYQHYQLDCKKCYCKVYYGEDGSPDSLEGKAWMHVFWNNGMNDFQLGDTLDITVEVINPPNIDSDFRITDNDNNTSFIKLDSLDSKWTNETDHATFISGAFYNYRTVIDDSTEYFEMENTFSYNGDKWKTVKRHQPFFQLKE